VDDLGSTGDIASHDASTNRLIRLAKTR